VKLDGKGTHSTQHVTRDVEKTHC